jgi:hypothetical protein
MALENSDLFFRLLPVILVILGLGIVSIVGWLVWIFTRPGGRRPPGGQQEQERSVTVEPTTAVTQQQPPAHFVSLVRGTDGWEIYVRGRRYGSLDDVPDTQTRDEVVDSIRALARFAQDYVQRQRGADPKRTTTEVGARVPRDQPTVPTEPRVPSDRSMPHASGVAAVESVPRRVPSSPALIPSINLAHEIGEIVAEMLAESPSLQGHAVTLTTGAGGGIVFAVDGKLYREIDQIPHPEIRELIGRATKEWERR